MTPHPLEELARWHDNRASEYNRLGTVSGRSQADQHTAFGSILRSAIPDCECGELVRETVEKHGWCSVSKFDFAPNERPPYYSIGTDSDQCGSPQTELGRGPTLATAVAAARANGAEGTK